jgi:WD40 repeat protein
VGITLYELLTSRPAFTASSRATLIDNILHTSPLSPRRIDPHIPRDLQTIVLKAMAADPSQRYARAEALAADLNRFIEDRPILARRLSPWGHTWRWCRRNKAVAALISLAAALLVVVAVVSLVSSFRLREQLEQTIAAQREVRKQLFDSLVVQARANWRSGIDGKRFQTLKVLRDATRIAHELELPRESFDQLRNEAIAALCLTDVEIAQTVDAYPTGSGMVDFDPQFERYARGYVEGHVTIHRISDNRILHRLPSPGPGLGVTKYFDGVVFSPNGQYLSQHCFGGDRPGHLRLWEVSGPEPRIVFDKPDGIVGTALAGSAFRPDSRQLAVVMTDPPPNENSAPAAAFGVHVFDTASGRECVSPLRADATTTIVYHPWISRLAVSDASAMRIVDLDTGAELSRWEYPNAICLAWSPDGRQLFAASESDRGIHRWDIANQRELSPLPGHRDSNAYAITFSHAGDLVVTLTFNGWRLWEFRSGRLVWDSPEGSTLHMRFSRDDRLLAATHGVIPTMRLLRVASGQEIQRLPLEAWNAGSSPGSVLSGDGRMLAATSRDSITLIDVLRGNELAIIPGYRIPLAFEPDGSLLTFAKLPDGVARWPLITDSSRRERITLGPKQQLTAISTEGAFGGGHTWSTSADGRVIAVPNCFHGSNVFVATSTDDSPTHEYRCIELGPQHDVQHVSVSPDGRWVAAGSRNLLANPTDSLTTTIWESARGKRIKDFPNLGIPKFSPDGKWLAVGSSSFAGSVGVWNVGPWMPGPTVESIAGPGIGPGNANVAFGPNSQLMAVECYSFIRLVNPATGREVARLAIPDATQLVPQCFTPDGTRLIAFGLNNGQLYIWDLRAIREQLAELGLDRNAPTYDPAPSAELPPALEVEVVP